MIRLPAALAALALVLPACGDDDPPDGGTPPAATPTAQASPANDARGRFCSKAGAELADVSQDVAQVAGDAQELERLTDKTLALVKDAPPGAACAVVPLRTLIQAHRTAGNTAAAKRLTRFARKHRLTKARY
jgi:hypothetical protein